MVASRLVSAVVATLCASLGCLVFGLPVASADSCPNAAERFGASANLPDCRAYELVTPEVKEDVSSLEDIFGFSDGNHLVFQSFLPLPGAATGEREDALSARTASGWVTTPLTPSSGPGSTPNEIATAQTEKAGLGLFLADQMSFTSDFSAAFINWQFASDPLDQNSGMDVYRVDIPSRASSIESLPESGPSTESLINLPGIGPEKGAPGSYFPGGYLAGSSGDGSRVFFLTNAKLPTAPGTPENNTYPSSVELYERHDGSTYLVGLMSGGGVPSCGADIGQGGMSPMSNNNKFKYGAISSDGSNVVFKTPGPGSWTGSECGSVTPGLYLRKDYNTQTVPLPGFWFGGRSRDGTKIFTGDSEHIYEYDVESNQATTIATGSKPGLIASSADGSRVFYLMQETLYVYDKGVTDTIPNAGGGYYGQTIEPGPSLEFYPDFKDLGYATPDGSELGAELYDHIPARGDGRSGAGSRA